MARCGEAKTTIDIDVQLPGGSIERVSCICYEYNRAWVGEAPVIASGDWVRDRPPDR